MPPISVPTSRPLPAGVIVSIDRYSEPDNSPLLSIAKEQLRAETTAHDALIQRLIDSSVRYVEQIARVSLFDQSRRLVLDSPPNDDYIPLFGPPVKAVTTFTTYNLQDIADTTFAGYLLDIPGVRLILKNGYSWPDNLRPRSAVQIVYTTGFGTTVAGLPRDLVQAVLLLTTHWYENPSAVGCDPSPEMANSVRDIVGIERRWRL
jgi:uncharacterized phiE125 gp8 family phage protein